MDFGELYQFLFESYTGIFVLVGVSLVICIILAFIMERKARKTYVDRGEPNEEDEWSLFDDDDDDKDEEAEN